MKPSLELRNEAAAALARPDLLEVARFPATFGEAGSSAVFTSDLGRYITPEPSGGFSLRAANDQPVARYRRSCRTLLDAKPGAVNSNWRRGSSE